MIMPVLSPSPPSVASAMKDLIDLCRFEFFSVKPPFGKKGNAFVIFLRRDSQRWTTDLIGFFDWYGFRPSRVLRTNLESKIWIFGFRYWWIRSTNNYIDNPRINGRDFLGDWQPKLSRGRSGLRFSPRFRNYIYTHRDLYR